jgi:methyl-accepting chemotaxis protein
MVKSHPAGLIKNFSIVGRLRVTAVLALIAVLVTCATGYVGLTQSNVDSEQSSIVTRAVLSQKQADMMHDALRADVLYANQIGPDGSAADRASVLDDLSAHIAEFEKSIATLDNLPLDPEIKRDVNAVRPLMQAYLSAAQLATDAAIADPATGSCPRAWCRFWLGWSPAFSG